MQMGMEKTKKTVVLGASDNPARYSYLAINRLTAHGHPVTAIGKKTGQVNGVPIITDHPPLTGTDTITLYLNAQNQKTYYDYILSLHPKRIIFNPGAENPELEELARQNNIQPLDACTLVLLSTGQY
jgi:predicted CoA-binding protein